MGRQGFAEEAIVSTRNILLPAVAIGSSGATTAAIMTNHADASPWIVGEQSIEAERIPDADNITRGIVIEPERNVEVDLLGSVHMIKRARIQEQAGTGTFGIVADIFGKHAKFLRQLLFQHEGGLGDALGREVRRAEELGEHAADAPAIMQLPRPGKLEILRATTGDRDHAGRQRHAEYDR